MDCGKEGEEECEGKMDMDCCKEGHEEGNKCPMFEDDNNNVKKDTVIIKKTVKK